MTTEASPYIDALVRRIAGARSTNAEAAKVLREFQEFSPPPEWRIEFASRLYWEIPSVKASLFVDLLECPLSHIHRHVQRCTIRPCCKQCGRPIGRVTSRADLKLPCKSCMRHRQVEQHAERRREEQEHLQNQLDVNLQEMGQSLVRVVAGALAVCETDQERDYVWEMLDSQFDWRIEDRSKIEQLFLNAEREAARMRLEAQAFREWKDRRGSN